jgi:hypothetical protein
MPTDPTGTAYAELSTSTTFYIRGTAYGLEPYGARGWFATRRGTTRASSPRPYAARRCYQRITYAIPIDPCRHYSR